MQSGERRWSRWAALGLGLSAAAVAVVGLNAAAAAQGTPPANQTRALFNGRDLAGWTYFLVDPQKKLEDVWSVRDGVLVCKGEPLGYLRTLDEYTSYRLVVEWRWNAEAAAKLGKTPNSGVFLRMGGEPRSLPRGYEAQLMSGHAGDLYGFWGRKLTGDATRLRSKTADPMVGDMVGVMAASANEQPLGEWNRYEVVLEGTSVVILVNGTQVNEATGLDVVPGWIGLQSEGGEIHFRKVEISDYK
jgi:hypothetical protein